MHTPGPWTVGGDPGTSKSHPQLTIESDYGQVATVLGENCDIDQQVEDDAKLIAAAPQMKSALEHTLAWMTNVNVNDPATLGRQIMTALEKAGVDKETLDLAAVALVRGPCAVPNLVGDENDRSLSPSSIFTNRERFIMFTALTYMRRTHQQQNGKIVPYSDVPNFPHVRLDPCEIEKLIATFA